MTKEGRSALDLCRTKEGRSALGLCRTKEGRSALFCTIGMSTPFLSMIENRNQSLIFREAHVCMNGTEWYSGMPLEPLPLPISSTPLWITGKIVLHPLTGDDMYIKHVSYCTCV